MRLVNVFRRVVVAVAAMAVVVPLAACDGGGEPVQSSVSDNGVSHSVVARPVVPETQADATAEPTEAPETNEVPDIEALAMSVIYGDYGTGSERVARLGELYEVVQCRVNELMQPAPVQSETVRSETVQPAPVQSVPVRSEAVQPVADTVVVSPTEPVDPIHGDDASPAVQYAAWLTEFAGYDYYAGYEFPVFENIPACAYEDGSGMSVCKWDASAMGNGAGSSYVLVDGNKVVEW